VALGFILAAIGQYIELRGWVVVAILVAGVVLFLIGRYYFRRYDMMEKRFLSNLNGEKKRPAEGSGKEKAQALPDPDLKLHSFELSKDSPIVGKMLRDSELRDHELTLISVRRGTTYNSNPRADFVFEPGDTIWVDGVIKVVDNYARRLTKYCDVVVFCPEARGYDKTADDSLPYEVVRCAALPLLNLDYTLPASALDPLFDARLITSGIDIVHIHSPFNIGILGVLYAKVHGLPVVATLHSQYRQDFEKPLRLKPAVDIAMGGVMLAFNACNECWAVNEGIKDLYVNEYGLTAPCKVRLNATDHRPVADREGAARIVNERFGIPEDATVFLFIGRINFIKNIDFTVRALAIAKSRGLTNFRMLFVGRGQDEDKLARVVREQGLEDEVVMCGLVSEKEMLERIYSRARLFLFPSLYDANSLVQIEAACQGTPTVFLEGARTAATVTPGVNGYISPAGEEAYAQTILDIMADPEGYARVSAAAKRDLYLDWDSVVADVYKDYCNFLDI